MKHELFTPDLVVSLANIAALCGIRRDANGWMFIGAMTTIADVARNERMIAHAPALAQAASLVAGPQLRTMGTLGGNVMLDTRCQWYNQTYFWRQALGFCLKKDGTQCHVVEGGSKCVADQAYALQPADSSHPAFSLSQNDPLVKYLKENHSPIVLDELNRLRPTTELDQVAVRMRSLKLAVVMGVFARSSFRGHVSRSPPIRAHLWHDGAGRSAGPLRSARHCHRQRGALHRSPKRQDLQRNLRSKI